MALRPSGPPPTSPRSNLSRLLSVTLGAEATQSQPELQSQMDILMQADAENKLRNRKLYLILDLDETLVYSQRMKPGAVPVGHQIMVRKEPFDMVLRPGLEHFLKVIQKHFVVFMYTMGDEAYTHAVLDVLDPQRHYFRGAIPRASAPSRTSFVDAAPSNPCVVAGGVCSWRDPESRAFKYISRMACDKNMSVIIDDTIDVWRDSLPNLLLTRRFVGDPMDDGLQLLCLKLMELHAGYYAALRPDDSPTLTTSEVLNDLRGTLLEGCVIAFTGLVADQSEEVLANQPLCALVRLYGAEVTLDVDDATHLVARKKEGWKSATKIRRALQRQEVQPPAASPASSAAPVPHLAIAPPRLPPPHTNTKHAFPLRFRSAPALPWAVPCAVCSGRSTPHPHPRCDRRTLPSGRCGTTGCWIVSAHSSGSPR